MSDSDGLNNFTLDILGTQCTAYTQCCTYTSLGGCRNLSQGAESWHPQNLQHPFRRAPQCLGAEGTVVAPLALQRADR